MSDITDKYVKHALTLIRVSNKYALDANVDIRRLALALRRLLGSSDLSNIGLRALRAVVSEADQLINAAFQAIKDRQNDATQELIDIEARWARQIGKYSSEASDAAIARANANFNVFGNTTNEHFDNIAARLKSNLRAQVRLGRAAQQTDKEIAARVVGTGADARGGVLDSTRNDTQALIDGSTQAAADAGRRATMLANGITALQHHAILDTHLCPNCGERADLIWSIDGQPIGHDLPYIPIPLHRWCRCIFLPLKLPPDRFDKVKAANTFEKWLDKLTEEEQDQILGVGRAALWRAGKITLQDLIGQNGLIMTLQELKATL